MKERVGEFTRLLEINGAWDRRHTADGKNYGIHSVEMRFVLIGPKGATQFLLYTNWHLRHVQEELDARPSGSFPHLICHPIAADLGYHSPVPMYEGQEPNEKCEYIGGPCYYDGSGLRAEDVYWKFVGEGEESVWADLMAEYEMRFEAVEVPA